MPTMPDIDIGDKRTWDDSTLIDSWNEASKEYQQYHSIAKSGKRLEDVLSKEELRELREDYGDLVEEGEDVAMEANDSADRENTGMLQAQTNGTEHALQEEAQQLETHTSEQQQSHEASAGNPALHGGPLASAMPQAILGTVQDENLKNIMMSWYYAGYYTGLHAGQQQALKDEHPKR